MLSAFYGYAEARFIKIGDIDDDLKFNFVVGLSDHTLLGRVQSLPSLGMAKAMGTMTIGSC